MTIKDLIPWSRSSMARPGEDNPLLALQRDINRVFEDTWTRFSSFGATGAGSGLRIDVAETDDAVEVTAELPGVDEKDLDLSLSEDMLTIKGERKSEQEQKNKDYTVHECSWGAFVRTIQLPARVQADKAEAEFNNGVLTVTLPKTPGAQEKMHKIKVKAH